MSEPRPYRKVIKSKLAGGRGSILGPDTWRRTHWWELTLECGHEVHRRARYVVLSHLSPWQRRRVLQRKRSDVLPPPKRSRCEYCWSEGGTGR